MRAAIAAILRAAGDAWLVVLDVLAMAGVGLIALGDIVAGDR